MECVKSSLQVGEQTGLDMLWCLGEEGREGRGGEGKGRARGKGGRQREKEETERGIENDF